MEFEDVSPVLVGRLGADASRGLLATLEATRQEWAAEVFAVSVERFNRQLSHEVATLRAATREGDAALRAELNDLVTSLRQETIAGRRALFKWSLLFWVFQAVTTAAAAASLLVLSGR